MSKRQTVFFTSVDPMNKEHKDPDAINLDAPRLAWYKSIKRDRTPSSFTTRSQLIVSRKLSG